MNKQTIGNALLAIVLLSLFWTTRAQAQVQGGGWSEPYRLSSEAGKSSQGYLAADQYGYMHCFWTETLFDGGETIIKYSRFDGTTWTRPNDIYITGIDIKNVSPVVDKQGTLHLAWAEGNSGPAYYTYAPATDALSAQNWVTPVRININARPTYLQVDSRGVLHIMYINEGEDESGIYHIRSEDRGITWSEPLWLDPDIQSGHVPDSLNFVLDENDGLHAVWWYSTSVLRGRPDLVRYSHSLDGGNTWSEPFTIDQYVEGIDHNLTNASPVMVVQGQTVHVIWAAGDLPYRNHRYSADGGFTWSAPSQIFGELHGQAFDSLTVDRDGRVHYFAQIRYPVGIYHAYWDQTRWSKPLLVYLIAEQEFVEGESNRVHAHHTIAATRAGNQLVLTFADGPADPLRRLFVTYRTLDDVLPLELAPIPAAPATPVPESLPTPQQPTPQTEWTATAPSLDPADLQPSGRVPAPDIAIRVALVPTLLVLGLTMIMKWLSGRKN